MPLIPFNLYLQNRMISQMDKANFDKEAFKEKCKNEWNNMTDKTRIFWIKHAFEQKFGNQEIIKKNKNSKSVSFRSDLVINAKPLHKLAVDEPKKLLSYANKYDLFRRPVLSSEDLVGTRPKERSSYIAQCWQSCKSVEQKKYDHLFKLLPELTSEIKLTKKMKGKKGERKNNIKNLKTTTKEEIVFVLDELEIPPACAFYLFMKNYYDLHPYRNDALNIWRKLSAKDRKVYDNILQDMRIQCTVDYKNFLDGYNFDKIEKYILDTNKTNSNIFCNYLNQA